MTRRLSYNDTALQDLSEILVHIARESGSPAADGCRKHEIIPHVSQLSASASDSSVRGVAVRTPDRVEELGRPNSWTINSSCVSVA